MSFRYITPLAKNVTRKKITFKNRYGLELAGDLYFTETLDETKTYPALIVAAPYGGVSRQGQTGIFTRAFCRII